MSSDLKRNGYKYSDIFRIYDFNIVLLTVNLSGTLKSIQQSMTNTKIPFARTPKVNNRTASPALYVAMPVVRKRLFIGIGVGGFLARSCRYSA